MSGPVRFQGEHFKENIIEFFFKQAVYINVGGCRNTPYRNRYIEVNLVGKLNQNRGDALRHFLPRFPIPRCIYFSMEYSLQ